MNETNNSSTFSTLFSFILVNVLQTNAVRVEKCLSLRIWHVVEDFFVQTTNVTHYIVKNKEMMITLYNLQAVESFYI